MWSAASFVPPLRRVQDAEAPSSLRFLPRLGRGRAPRPAAAAWARPMWTGGSLHPRKDGQAAPATSTAGPHWKRCRSFTPYSTLPRGCPTNPVALEKARLPRDIRLGWRCPEPGITPHRTLPSRRMSRWQSRSPCLVMPPQRKGSGPAPLCRMLCLLTNLPADAGGWPPAPPTYGKDPNRAKAAPHRRYFKVPLQSGPWSAESFAAHDSWNCTFMEHYVQALKANLGFPSNNRAIKNRERKPTTSYRYIYPHSAWSLSKKCFQSKKLRWAFC